MEPGPHWWEASALTTAPSLHPRVRMVVTVLTNMVITMLIMMMVMMMINYDNKCQPRLNDICIRETREDTYGTRSVLEFTNFVVLLPFFERKIVH